MAISLIWEVALMRFSSASVFTLRIWRKISERWQIRLVENLFAEPHYTQVRCLVCPGRFFYG